MPKSEFSKGSTPQQPSKRVLHGGVEPEIKGADYFEKRQLEEGVAGWVLLAGLGGIRHLW